MLEIFINIEINDVSYSLPDALKEQIATTSTCCLVKNEHSISVVYFTSFKKKFSVQKSIKVLIINKSLIFFISRNDHVEYKLVQVSQFSKKKLLFI